ncbi:MAG: hypothetical protein D6704_02600 [Nitrospirae bacterium]|nr:MAG: hypothetical protein D6704_02600 [Nitrospirota bacterium]
MYVTKEAHPALYRERSVSGRILYLQEQNYIHFHIHTPVSLLGDFFIEKVSSTPGQVEIRMDVAPLQFLLYVMGK